MFLLKDDMRYSLSRESLAAAAAAACPADKVGESVALRAHVAMLGFTPQCSVKSDPWMHASLQVAQHIDMEGLLSSSQPLQVKLLQDAELCAGD